MPSGLGSFLSCFDSASYTTPCSVDNNIDETKISQSPSKMTLKDVIEISVSIDTMCLVKKLEFLRRGLE
jgi:hypothetical protein